MFRLGELNLVVASTGSGKSYWCLNTMLNQLGNSVAPNQVLFVTSRSITAEQLSEKNGLAEKFNKNNAFLIDYWNGSELDIQRVAEIGINVMTYDKLIWILDGTGDGKHNILQNVKVVVLDECHCIFSDTFIRGMNMVWTWLRETIHARKKLCIGITATPGIISTHMAQLSAPVNVLGDANDTVYKAKQLVCTTFDTIPYLIGSNHLPGRSIVMCASIKDANKLMAQIPNSALLISQYSPEYTSDMQWLRSYIVRNESLPDNYPTTTVSDDGKSQTVWKHLNVLFTTSTMREGLNIREESGVRNMITCLTDELHVTQFVGRCRYSIDNLVVAQTPVRGINNMTQDPYILESRQSFAKFMQNKNFGEWFDSVSKLVQHDVYRVKKFVAGSDDAAFISFVNQKWLVPIGVTAKQMEAYRIWRDTDKQDLVDMAVKCKMIAKYPSKITFNRVVHMLENSLGYEVLSKRTIIADAQRTYKLIVSFDEEKKTYAPAIPWESDLWSDD